MTRTAEFLKNDIRKYESAGRYAHSLSVYEECMYFAGVFGLGRDETDVLERASLLHDIAKDISEDEKKRLCLKAGIAYSDSPVLHQDIGAVFAEELYGNETVDGHVASAISKHTTGGCGMNICDKILFVADYTEPTRKYQICADSRKKLHAMCENLKNPSRRECERVITEGVLFICAQTIEHLKEQGRYIDTRTLDTYNEARKTVEDSDIG